MKTIKITGIRNYERLERYFVSTMVDVAYIQYTDDGTANIIQDDPIQVNLEKDDDRKWLTDIIEKALNECGEKLARIEIIDN